MSDTYNNEFGGPLRYDPQEIARQGWGMAASGPRADQLIVGFFPKEMPDPVKSREMGVPVKKYVDYVKKQHPGETLMIIERPATDEDKRNYPRQWAAYKAQREQVPDGIPLEFVFPDQLHIRDFLKSRSVHTVEQLAGLSGQAMAEIGMGGQEWSNKAKAYLEQAQKGVDFHRFNKAMAESARENATLKRQVRELSEHVAKLSRVQPEPQNFDVQASQTAALKRQEIFSPEPAEFSNDFQPRRRGRPPGSRNKPKE